MMRVPVYGFCHCSFERPLLFLVANPLEQRLIVSRVYPLPHTGL